MLSLTSSALSFNSPSVLPRVGHATTGARAVTFANENEMEPEEGWNVDNLMGMMDEADEKMGGPTTKEVYENARSFELTFKTIES